MHLEHRTPSSRRRPRCALPSKRSPAVRPMSRPRLSSWCSAPISAMMRARSWRHPVRGADRTFHHCHRRCCALRHVHRLAGLGICYIGAIRNDAARSAALLDLPQQVYPLAGSAEVIRVPVSVVLKENSYSIDGEAEAIAIYDEEMRTTTPRGLPTSKFRAGQNRWPVCWARKAACICGLSLKARGF